MSEQLFESEFERGIERYANMLLANRGRKSAFEVCLHEHPEGYMQLLDLAERGRRAVAWFARHAPCRYQPLPISDDEQEHALCGDVHRLLTVFFSCSLRRQGFDYVLHPGFYQYSTGLLADPYCPVPVNPELLQVANTATFIMSRTASVQVLSPQRLASPTWMSDGRLPTGSILTSSAS